MCARGSNVPIVCIWLTEDAIIAAGALSLLVAFLRSPASYARTISRCAVDADGSQHRKGAIIAAGALPLLVSLLRTDHPTVQERSAAVLWNLLVKSQQHKDAIIAAGAAPLLDALTFQLCKDNQQALCQTWQLPLSK